MAYAIENRGTTPAEALRDALDEAERLIVKPNADTISGLLMLFDQIHQAFGELETTGGDWRPERARWETLLSRISSKPQPLAAAASAAGGMAKLREQHSSTDGFWWRLDSEVSQRRWQAIKRYTIMAVSIVAAVALVLWGVETLFPPDQDTILVVNTVSSVEDLILEGKWDEALLVVEEARQTLPDDPELLIWEAVLSEQLGDAERAQRSLDQAQQLLADRPVTFWVAVGNQRMRIGNLDGAEEAANLAIELNPEEPQAHFLLGSVAELKGDIGAAIELFDKTFILAEESEPQLAVIAKVRMGQLMQANPLGFPSEPEEGQEQEDSGQ